MQILDTLKAFNNKLFLKLYLAQTISMLGDAFTWLGLALLVYQLDPSKAPQVLASALTLRVTAYILFGPIAGVVSERYNQKYILIITHFIRMAIVCSLPFVDQTWQVYVIIFFLNVFNAFFTPTFQSIIPKVTKGQYYRESIGLSLATYQILGILGPAIAGMVTIWLSVRGIFFIDALSFILAAILITSIPTTALASKQMPSDKSFKSAWKDIILGISLLFKNPMIRFALLIEFVSALAGAMILVNSINLIKTNLQLTDKHYGWLMASLALGAALSAFVFGSLDKSRSRSKSLIFGALVLGIAILFANWASYDTLLILWTFAGIGQTLADMPAETLIGEQIAEQNQGKVFGSHFAFSHLWWAITYPIAGLLGMQFKGNDFLIGGSLTLLCLLIFILLKTLNSRSGY